MITPAQLAAAVIARLRETFPGEPIYENLTPRNFQRPSNLVELQKITMDAASLGGGAVGFVFRYRITTFAVVDEAHLTHLPALDLRTMAILGAFAQGYLRAGDRAPKVAACSSDNQSYDCAEVFLDLSLSMDRADFCPAELLPLMRELDLATEMKEETKL